MQNSQSVCLFNVTGNISCSKWHHSALSDGRHSPTNKNLMTHFTRRSGVAPNGTFHMHLNMLLSETANGTIFHPTQACNLCMSGVGWGRGSEGGGRHPSILPPTQPAPWMRADGLRHLRAGSIRQQHLTPIFPLHLSSYWIKGKNQVINHDRYVFNK